MTAALAEASGVRRSWLTAASSAVRIRSASAIGRAASASAASRCCSSATAGVGGERAEHPAVGGGQRSARAAPATGSSVDRHLDVGVVRAGRAAARRDVRDRGHRRPAAGRGPCRAGAGRAFQQRHRFHAERLADPVQHGRERPAAPRSTLPAVVDQQLGLGAGPGRLLGCAGRRVSTTELTTSATTTKTPSASALLASAMVNVWMRRGEEVVEQQRARRRPRARAGTKPPTSATAMTADQEHEHVAGQVELAAQAGQQPA